MHWSDCNAPLSWFLLGPNKNQMNELLEARKLNKNILALFDVTAVWLLMKRFNVEFEGSNLLP